MFHNEKKPMFETDQTSREGVNVGFGEYDIRSITLISKRKLQFIN